ncbi:ABC transporter permease [Mesorhizobium tamadayense]|uniref:ABC transporter permease n=1 Tax=Mesorhizobium tamadayense TaxID=425306 RepID=UPI00142E4B84|nr:ABC transporter permease [Mesorhizobium tamadayense]
MSVRTDPLPATVETVIDPSRKRRLIDLSELWRYREVVFFLAWRDFKVKYRQTYLGVLWAMLQPLVAMSVFSVFFGRLVGISSNGAPYPLFVLCGLVPWNFFSRAVGSMTGSLVNNQELVKRVYFPRLIIPMSAMAACLTDMIVGFALLFAALLAFGTWPVPQVLFLPLFVLVMAASATGLGVALSAINVRFRDVGYLVPFSLQIVLFMTPVVYPGSLVPHFWRPLYSMNPMVGIVEAVRWSVLGTPADWVMISISILSSLALLVAGLAIFSKSERAFPDLI